MATTITQQNPALESSRIFRDLDLKFNVHPVKKDVTKHVNEYAIINSIKNLVSTNFYERPFRPEIGSGIRNLLFENIDPVVAAQLERAIQETILNYEPRVQIYDIQTKASPDENRYDVTLTFFIINNPNPITIDFFLERIR
jgi:phage baseplate assembly protein W